MWHLPKSQNRSYLIYPVLILDQKLCGVTKPTASWISAVVRRSTLHPLLPVKLPIFRPRNYIRWATKAYSVPVHVCVAASAALANARSNSSDASSSSSISNSIRLRIVAQSRSLTVVSSILQFRVYAARRKFPLFLAIFFVSYPRSSLNGTEPKLSIFWRFSTTWQLTVNIFGTKRDTDNRGNGVGNYKGSPA